MRNAPQQCQTPELARNCNSETHSHISLATRRQDGPTSSRFKKNRNTLENARLYRSFAHVYIVKRSASVVLSRLLYETSRYHGLQTTFIERSRKQRKNHRRDTYHNASQQSKCNHHRRT